MTTEPSPAANDFASDLLFGRFAFGLVHPFPPPTRSENVEIGAAGVAREWLRVSASSVAESKRLLAQARVAAASSGLGKREVFAEKLACLAGETFAMEAMALYAAAVASPSAVQLAKVWTSERVREHAELALQIDVAVGRGSGSGDLPGMTGSNDELRLDVARVVIARHWETIAPMLDAQRVGKERFEAAQSAAWKYAR